MMKDLETVPPLHLQQPRRDSLAKMQITQSQLSNLTYRKVKHTAAIRERPTSSEPQYELNFDVNLDGIPPCQIHFRTSKSTRADEVLRHVLHQLSSNGYQRRAVDSYAISEVVYDDLGQVCKERRLTFDDHPAQLQLLWPKEHLSPGSSDSDSFTRETYAFRVSDCLPDVPEPHPKWLECDLASYFASDSFLHKFFSDDDTVADLCQLPELTEATILNNLQDRFEEGRIYTSAGPSILVSINPYKFYPLYNPKVVSLYQTEIQPSLNLPPHIFAIADVAYNTMMRHRRDQCIVISGESGSGKTECTHFILHHLTALSHKGAEQGGKIEQSILSAAPVLEAFGNAKTAHNNNSSRFGKYIQVHYKPDGKVARANVQQYLLEKSRIVSQARNERNYHVFYYMLAGSNEEEKKKLRLDSIESYDYLNQSNYGDMNGLDCTFELDRLKQAMEMVGFSRETQTRIFSVLSAVLHIGNIQYVKKASSYHHDESVIIQNREVLAIVASLLQVNEEVLHSALISKCAIAYNEALIMNYKLPEAINARDALAKLLYCSLFDWIVNQTNRLLHSSRSAKDKEVSIGVLDIFGFENFERNSFEQFCINYANEHLQSYFNLHVFKYEQDEYISEGIDWKPIAYTDNTPCLDLIQQKPYGLLPLLNEECSFPGATNETLLEKYRRHQVNNEYFDSPQKRENAFIVHHYAGTVKYDVKNFREKNSDANRAADLVLLLKTSLSGFLREMVAESPTAMARWRMLKLTVMTVLAFTRRTRRRQSFSVEQPVGGVSPPRASTIDEDVRRQRGSLTGSIEKKGLPVSVKRNFSPQAGARTHRTNDLPSHVPKARRGVTHQTVTGQFQQSLTKLMEALNKADPYFIRCIKSNNSKTPGLFDQETVLRQLRYSGMLETVRIRRSGYHIRLSYKEFESHYHALLPDKFIGTMEDVRQCLLRWGLDEGNFQIGRKKIYLRELEKQKLDDLLHKYVLRNIVKIQRWWRTSNRELKEKSALAIQRHWRGYVARNDYRRRRVATLIIQRWWRSAQTRRNARRFVKNLEKRTTIAEEEEDGEEARPVTISPVGRSLTGHSTPFSSFSSDWNSHFSDEGVQLNKTVSTEDISIPRSHGKLVIRTPLRRESYAAPPERSRRDSEEESSGILDDSEPESYQAPTSSSTTGRKETHIFHPSLATPRVEPKPWRRYSAIEPTIPSPTSPEKPHQERSVDVYNEKAVDVVEEPELQQHIRPSPPRQLPAHHRTTRRDTLPKREHYSTTESVQQAKAGKMGAFKSWLGKKVAAKKKSDDSESLRMSPELVEDEEQVRTPSMRRAAAGCTPYKYPQDGAATRPSDLPVRKLVLKSTAMTKRAKSVSAAKSPMSESSSILPALTRTFSKNRLKRRPGRSTTESLASDTKLKMHPLKEPSWNCRSITEFTDSEDRVVSSAEELRDLETFIFDKILQMGSSMKGKSATRADQIFQQALKEFRNNLISTYSVAVKDVRLCIRYRDLIVNFEKTIRVACYKIIQSRSPPYTTAALAQNDAEGFPVNMAINAFRSFMNEFMQRQQTRMREETIKYRTLSRKRKVEQSVLNKNGHQLVSVNIFNLPTACEVCGCFLWPMEKGLVCQLCKTTCHKKCYQKIENSCNGKRKIKKTSPGAAPATLQPSQPSGRVFCVPLDCLLMAGEKIPAIADRLITCIELQGVYTEWIYRKSGGIPGMRALRAAIEDGYEKIEWDQYHDSGIHLVASTFKAMLREMPEPLMTFERYDELMDIMDMDNDEEQLQHVYVSIRKMPKPNHDLLERVFFHLARVAQHADVNQMNAENLAIVFAPVLFRPDRDLKSFEVSDDYKKQIKCIQIVIDAQLQKLQTTLEDIGQIDSAAMSVNTRLSVIRSSKVFPGATNSRIGSPNVPETIPDVDEEEVRLANQIQSLRKEKEKRTMDLASLRLSRQASQEGSHSSQEDVRVAPVDAWRRRRSSQLPRRHQFSAPKKDDVVWL